MEQTKCDLLCGNKATRRFGKLFICESCATHPENQINTGFSEVRGSDKEKEISLEHPWNNGERALAPSTKTPRRRFLSGMRPRTSWDGDEEEFMATAAHRLYRVNFVGRFAQRVDMAIAHYHARVEKANRIAQQRASSHKSAYFLDDEI